MPLFALCFNFAWEVIYALYVVESLLEQVVFTVWLVIDCYMIYGVFLNGHLEWKHAPAIAKRLWLIVPVMTIYCAVGHWAFAKWWIDGKVGKKEGKFYGGVVTADTTE
jgi:hypothetical protein